MRGPRSIAGGAYTTMGWARPRAAWGAFVVVLSILRGANRPVTPRRALSLAREARRLLSEARTLRRRIADLAASNRRLDVAIASRSARIDQLSAQLRDERGESEAGEEWRR